MPAKTTMKGVNIMFTGTSYGSGLTSFEGLRVAGQTTYIPAHTTAEGKQVSQHLRVPVYLNQRRSNRADQYDITMWGKLADVCANLLAPGCEFNARCRPNSYQGRVFDENGNPYLKGDGTPITTRKTSFSVVMDFKIIADSRNQIQKELNEGKRQPNWDDGGAGQEAFRQQRKIKAAQQYVPGSAEFGHARVIQPAGATLVPQTAMAPAGNVDAAALIANPQVQALLSAMNITPPAATPAGNATAAPAGGGTVAGQIPV
jgi:hypothetical protein